MEQGVNQMNRHAEEDYKPAALPHAFKIIHGSLFPTKGDHAVSTAGSLQLLRSFKAAAIRCQGLGRFETLIPEAAKCWREKLHKVPNRIHSELHFGLAPCSVSQDSAETHTYYLAVEVSSFEGLPEEFERIEVRADHYAVVRKEPGQDVKDIYAAAHKFIRNEQKRMAPKDAEPLAYQFEIFYESMEAYGERLSGAAGRPFVMDLCIPVEDSEGYRPTSVPSVFKVLHQPLEGTDTDSVDRSTATEGPAPIERFVPQIVFDGGTVTTTLEEHEEMIAWLERHAGWKIAQQENWKPVPQAAVGKMTHMGWGVWIESGSSSEGEPVPAAAKGPFDPFVRWCWRTGNVQEKRQELMANGVRVSELYRDPEGLESFDFWAGPKEMLLTAIEDPAWKESSLADANRFRITVRHLQKSMEWYHNYIGMETVTDRSEHGYAVMKLGINYHPDGQSRWLLEEDPSRPETGPVDGLFRTRCIISSRESFFKYHQFLRDSGVEVSEVTGFLQRGRVCFHLYDPDGNRFDVSSF
ncbi:hypothetical protein GCM10023310_16230 [Paenibacillus vulneris]|uniref:VOC family protein n=1 Tax=Paenibacillus vulneris TaxID=1133364 RepID=A0ABW3UJU7_9BACL